MYIIADISVPGGGSDFRSPTVIFSKLRNQLKVNGRDLFTYNLGIKEGTRNLKEFPKSRVYSQNIDELEEKSGIIFSIIDKKKGVYLHGNLSNLNWYKQEFTEVERLKYSNNQDIESLNF